MKAKEYLQQLKKLDIMINQKTKELEELRIKARSINSVDYSKERVQSSPSTDAPFVKNIEKITDLENEINCEIDNFVDKKHEIIQQIQGLKNSKYIEVLYKRYVEYKRFEVIAKEMYYSCDYIKHLHGYALSEFEKQLLNLAPNSTL